MCDMKHFKSLRSQDLNPYIPTYQLYKRPYTLHTYPTTTYVPSLPTLPLQTYKRLVMCYTKHF